MKNSTPITPENLTKENAIWMLLLPQLFILGISTAWILISPKDNVIVYLKYNPTFFLYGLILAFILAFSGYGFYRFAKVFKDKNKSLDNLVFYFENALSPLIKKLGPFDIAMASLVSGFCEEVFFRGILTAKFGIIVSSLAFGLLHIPTGKEGKVWIYAFWATICGALLGWVFLHYQNLWVTVIAHIVNNIIGMILLKRIKV